MVQFSLYEVIFLYMLSTAGRMDDAIRIATAINACNFIHNIPRCILNFLFTSDKIVLRIMKQTSSECRVYEGIKNERKKY